MTGKTFGIAGEKTQMRKKKEPGTEKNIKIKCLKFMTTRTFSLENSNGVDH